jgi:CHAT domain-containing protein
MVAAPAALLLSAGGDNRAGYSQTQYRIAEILETERISPLRLTRGSPLRDCPKARIQGGLPESGTCVDPPAPGSRRFEDLARLPIARGDSQKAIRARAYWGMAFQEIRALERAIWELERAIERDQEPGLINELAIAFWLRSSLNGEPLDLFRALDAIEWSLEIEPSPAALFNRALVLQRLHLSALAEHAWDQYLEQETDSYWIAEALSYRKEVEREDPCHRMVDRLEAAASSTMGWPSHSEVSACRRDAESWIEQRMADWAQQVSRGTISPLGVGAVEHVIELIDAMDPYWTDIVNQLKGSEGFRRERLASAFLKTVVAEDRIRANEYSRARDLLTTARREVAETGSPIGLHIEFLLARCDYNLKDYDRCLQILEGLEERFGDHPYWRLRGLAARFEGLVYGARGVASRSNQEALRALDYFERGGHEEDRIHLFSLIFEDFDVLGAAGEAWGLWLEGISSPVAMRRARTRFNLLEVVPRSLHRIDLVRAAQDVAEELVLVGGLVDNPVYSYQALVRRIEAALWLGRTEAAQADLEEAYRVADTFTDPQRRIRTLGTLDLLAGELHLLSGLDRAAADPAQAVGRLSAALRSHEVKGYAFYLPRILEARGRAFALMGRWTDARDDLEAALGEMERFLDTVDPDDLRISYFDQSRKLFDRRIELELATSGSAWQALVVAERSRLEAKGDIGRLSSQLDQRRGAAVETSLRATVAASRHGLSAIAYHLLEDELLIWTLHGGEIALDRSPAGAPVVARRVAELRDRLEARDDIQAVSRELHGLLLDRPLSRLGDDQGVVLLPDGILRAIPFGLLLNEDGRLFFESRTFEIAETVVSSASARAPVPANWPATVLALSSPEAPWELGLGRLRNASSEVEALSDLWGSRVVGTPTDEEGFRSTLVESDLFHFTGHATVHHEFPMRSALLLPVGFRDPFFSYQDISQLDLRHGPVVMLSSCQSAFGMLSPSAGALSLAHAFLSAGASRVIANVFAVDDEVGRELAVRFHEQLAAGHRPAIALQRAQMSLLAERGLEEAATWGGYSVYLGSAAEP